RTDGQDVWDFHGEERSEHGQDICLGVDAACKPLSERESAHHLLADPEDRVDGPGRLDTTHRQVCPFRELVGEEAPDQRDGDFDLIVMHLRATHGHTGRHTWSTANFRATTREKPKVWPSSASRAAAQAGICSSKPVARSDCCQCFHPSGTRSACSTSTRPVRCQCSRHQSGPGKDQKSQLRTFRSSVASLSSLTPAGTTMASRPSGLRKRTMYPMWQSSVPR